MEEKGSSEVAFHQLPIPTTGEVEAVAVNTCRRVHDILVRRGLWREDRDLLEENDSGMPHQGQRAAPDCDGKGLTWSQLLARTFALDLFSCKRCGGRLVRIAIITAPTVIRKILRAVGLATDAPASSPARSSLDLFDSRAA